MHNRLKTLLLIACVSILTFCIIGQIFFRSNPASSNFPLKLDWKTHLTGNTYGISIADNKTALVLTSASLYVIDTDNGNIIWNYYLSTWLADAKPAIAKNGKVFVTDGYSVVALDQKTGSVLWKQVLSTYSLWLTDASENVVIINQLGDDITAIDANTGNIL